MLGLTASDMKKSVKSDAEEDLALMPGEPEPVVEEPPKPPSPPKYTYLKREDVITFDKPVKELTKSERLALSW